MAYTQRTYLIAQAHPMLVSSNYVRARYLVYAIVALLLLSEKSIATTVVLVLTRKFIAIGADSQLAPVSLGSALPEAPSLKKTSIIQNRMIVAAVGVDVAKIWGKKEGRFVFTYAFTTWMDRIKEECPKDATVSELTHLVEVESGATFKDFSQFINNYWTGHKVETTNFVDYLVAGYQDGIPKVNRVYFNVDWNNLQLKGPFTESLYSGPQAGFSSDIYLDGMQEVVEGLKNRQSDTYNELSVMIPKELPKVIAGQELTENEATRTCLAVLRYETKHHKGFVGPPFIITTIRRSGSGGAIERSYSEK